MAEEGLEKPIEQLAKQIALLGESVRGIPSSVVAADSGSTFNDKGKESKNPILTPNEVRRTEQEAVIFGKALGIGSFKPKGKLEDLTPEAVRDTVKASEQTKKEGFSILGAIEGLLGGAIKLGTYLFGIAGLIKLYNSWSSVLGENFDWIKDIQTFFKPFTDFFDGLGKAIDEYLKKNFPAIHGMISFLGEILDYLVSFLSPDSAVGKGLLGFLKELNDPQSKLNQGIGNFKQFFVNLGDPDSDLRKSMKQFFDDLTKGAKIFAYVMSNPKDALYNMATYGQFTAPAPRTVAGEEYKAIPGEELLKVPAKTLLGISDLYGKAYSWMFGQSELYENIKNKLGQDIKEDWDITARAKIAKDMGTTVEMLEEMQKNSRIKTYEDEVKAGRINRVDDGVFINGQAYGINSEDDLVALKAGGAIDRLLNKQDSRMVMFSRELIDTAREQLNVLRQIAMNTSEMNRMPVVIPQQQNNAQATPKMRRYNRSEFDIDTSPLFGDFKLI